MLTMCPIIKRGNICLGGASSNCGLGHSTPVKYCPKIAKGRGCAGECGFFHNAMQSDEIHCIDGMRAGNPCTLKICIFRHPDDKVPEPRLEIEEEEDAE